MLTEICILDTHDTIIEPVQLVCYLRSSHQIQVFYPSVVNFRYYIVMEKISLNLQEGEDIQKLLGISFFC